MKNIFLLVCLIKILTIVKSSESNPYRNRRVLDNGKYLLEWFADWGNMQIYFNVTVATKGYIGFGLSRKGLMNKADIVIGGVGVDGRPYFSDRHGIFHQPPALDKSQDWALHTAWESHSHTFLSFSRAFESCDEEDVSINEDNVIAVIWAYGETDNETEYHYQNKGVVNIYLLDPDFTPTQSTESHKNWKLWSIDMDQRVPTQDTTYFCTFHKAPESTKHHIVGFRVKFNSQVEEEHVHHLILHRCYAPQGITASDLFSRHVGQPPQECYLRSLPQGNAPVQFCEELRYEWAVGGGSLFLPKHVGLAFADSPNEFYKLQVHYNNPNLLQNLQVKFSLQLFYTDQLRKHDAGLLAVGIQVGGNTAPTIMIPPSETSHVSYGLCAAGCTQKMFPPRGINIFTSKLHTHLAGTGVRFMQIRNGQEQRIGIDDNYNSNFQPHRILRKEVRVQAGDRLYSRCTYQTARRNQATVGGFSTSDEMCAGWAFYYPYITKGVYSSCWSQIRADAYNDFRQIFNTTFAPSLREYLVTEPRHNAGFSMKQVASQINWTIENRLKLQTHHRFLPQISVCRNADPKAYLADETARLDGSLRYLGPKYFSDIQKEIRDRENEFIYLWPKGVNWYKRDSECPKK